MSTETTTSTGSDPQGGGQDPTQQTVTTTTAPAEWDGKVESLPSGVQKLIRDLREENGNTRVAAKQQAADEARQALVNDLGKALGLVGDGGQDPTPEQLADQLTGAQRDAQQSAVQLAVYRAAGQAGADPEALLDSRRFLDSLADVDPSDGTAVTKAITDAVTANPKLKAGRAPGASSVDHGANSPRESTNRTPLSIADAVRGTYGT